MATNSDPCSAGFFSKLFSGNAIVCNGTFQAWEQSQEEAGIQSVADASARLNGADSVTAAVTQQAANAQILAARADTSTINNQIAASNVDKVFGGDCDDGPGVDLSFIGGPCLSYDRLKKYSLYAGIVLGGLVLLYVLGIVSSFIPKRG